MAGNPRTRNGKAHGWADAMTGAAAGATTGASKADAAPPPDPNRSRLTGRALQAIRAHWFTLHPLCVRCKANGRVAIAEELDHVVALTNGGADFDEDGGTNRQGLCKPCHALKTNADLGRRASGCDELGRPIDPAHPWNHRGA